MSIKTIPTGQPQTAETKPGLPMNAPRVVIVGGGFGGLAAAKKLEKLPVQVTVIDRTNYHLFQPMLYEVTATSLSPTDIATPIRDLLGKERTNVVMDEVTGVDTQQQMVLTKKKTSIPYDYLILATGSANNYFGHPEWENIAPGMKSLDDAMTIKNALLSSMEAAEQEPDEEKRKALLTMVLVGGGATGCELAAKIAEQKHGMKRRNFQRVRPRDVRIVLVEAGPRLMAAFAPSLSKNVQKHLNKLGVEVRTGLQVKEITNEGVLIGDKFLAAQNVFWVAGVKASPAGEWLGAEVDHSGRVKVQGDLSVPGHPNIFVIGDTACVMQKNKPLPGLAQPALQGGHYVASVIADQIDGKEHPQAFSYFDKGSLAIMGRSYAIFENGPIHIAGIFAWMIWLFVHIYFLIGSRHRFTVFLRYSWAFVTPIQQSPGSRIIFSERILRTFD